MNAAKSAIYTRERKHFLRIEETATVTLVDIDFEQYKRENDTTPVKKTLAIPMHLIVLPKL